MLLRDWTVLVRVIVGFLLTVLFVAKAQAEKTTFQHDGNTLVAHYLSPKTDHHKGVILFVQGDGDLNYNAHGYYPLIWNGLRDQGYAIFSWNKPGVGGSTGHWLDQTMQDRQGEVRAAIRFVESTYPNANQKIGLLGFSQAGWVVPAVASDEPAVDFVIGIGFAINWSEQGWYLSRKYLESKGESAADIDLAYKRYLEGESFLEKQLGYQQYIERNSQSAQLMSEQRYYFVLKNFAADATADYLGLKQPTLILLGEHDINVDIQNTRKKLLQVFSNKDNMQIETIAGASHGLLKSNYFKQQIPGFRFWLKMQWMGESSLAPSFQPILHQWLSRLHGQEVEESANSPMGWTPPRPLIVGVEAPE